MPLCLNCKSLLREKAQYCHWCGQEVKRVGLFVDYENFRKIGWVRESGLSTKRKGEVLKNHAARYGKVVCSWICAHPNNIRNWSQVKSDLQQVGYEIAKPAEVVTGGIDRMFPSQADHALIRLLYEESLRSQPNLYIIVSGDIDYYEHIVMLIKKGYSVHLWGSKIDGHLSCKYYQLAQKYGQGVLKESGTGIFTIDNLDVIFHSQGVRRFFRRPNKDEPSTVAS